MSRLESKKLDDMLPSNGNSNGVTQVKIEDLVHFGGGFDGIKSLNGKELKSHPFRLYSGERLDDMVESIATNGVLVPIIVRQKEGALEILAGHNRTEAAKIAGFTEIPAIVLEDVSDEVALAYVVETNLIQRSFSEMVHSEKAAVIANYHSKMFSQGKRNDIIAQLHALENPESAEDSTSSQLETKSRTDEKLGEIYNLSRATVARYVRINKLWGGLKMHLDDGILPFTASVEVSFLPLKTQQILCDCLDDGYKISLKQAIFLREYCKENTVNRWRMEDILLGKTDEDEIKPEKPRRIKVNGNVYSRYFTGHTPDEVESIVEKALQMYFEGVAKVEQ